MPKIKRLFHTLRHLKPVQFYGRLWYRLYKPRPDLKPRPEIKLTTGKWREMARREPSLLGPLHFRFLNVEREILKPADWNDAGMEKLWLYNLHYLDDLNANGADRRKNWHANLIEKWIDENPPGQGNGWEPYPLSLRIINWIKRILNGNILSEKAIQSLVVQTRYLNRRLEKHLLGNHLLANAKALFFAGYYFNGTEADNWRTTGEKVLFEQLHEQILPDGGHFERSPMYHSIVLEDVLDCLNLVTTYGNEGTDQNRSLREKVISMSNFLKSILHPDGEIPFFNDSAVNIAPAPAELFKYSKQFGITPSTFETFGNIIRKPDFGLWVIKSGDLHVIVDAGPIGPDYLTGHAHCDTLSYEMSVAGKRFIVNSGTYAYEGPERHWFRSTAAHNTVRIDGEEQHEIWAKFRVARRGYPFDVIAEEINGECRFEAAHNGYRRLKGSPVHRRKIRIGEGNMSVEDAIEGTGTHQVENYIHLHPDVEIVKIDDDKVRCTLDGKLITIWITSDENFQVEKSFFSPQFGKKLENKVVVLRKKGPTPFFMNYEILIH